MGGEKPAGIVLTQYRFNQTPHEFGDVGMNLLDNYMQTNEDNIYGGVDDAMDFWEGLLAKGYPAEENNGVVGMSHGGDIAMYDGPPAAVLNSNSTLLNSEDGGDNSSTGSLDDVCILADFETEHDLAIVASSVSQTSVMLSANEEDLAL